MWVSDVCRIFLIMQLKRTDVAPIIAWLVGEAYPVLAGKQDVFIDLDWVSKRIMYQINAVTRCFGGLMTGLVLSLSPIVTVQAEDDYLRLLEAEAADTGAGSEPVESLENAKIQNKKARNLKVDKAIEQGLTFEEFEETLSTHYSGSNFLYMKLTEKERKGIYKYYQSNNLIASVREEIVRRLSSS